MQIVVTIAVNVQFAAMVNIKLNNVVVINARTLTSNSAQITVRIAGITLQMIVLESVPKNVINHAVIVQGNKC